MCSSNLTEELLEFRSSHYTIHDSLITVIGKCYAARTRFYLTNCYVNFSASMQYSTQDVNNTVEMSKHATS